jgi:hypothetical protein
MNIAHLREQASGWAENTLLAMDEIEQLRQVNKELLEALTSLKKALGPEGEYAICRADNQPMGFGETIYVGCWFEKASAAMTKAEEALSDLK